MVQRMQILVPLLTTLTLVTEKYFILLPYIRLAYMTLHNNNNNYYYYSIFKSQKGSVKALNFLIPIVVPHNYIIIT